MSTTPQNKKPQGAVESPTISTPPPKPEGTPPSPSNKQDGIDLSKRYLPRAAIIESIYQTALESQHVVIGSPASTGKTSLLSILKRALLKKKCKVIHLLCIDIGVQELFKELYESGFPRSTDGLEALENTWLLIDDAQTSYAQQYEPFWHRLVKGIAGLGIERKLSIVIAATYDLSTPESPVNFCDLAHVDPNICEAEANQLIRMHLEHWQLHGWDNFRNTLLGLSALSGKEDKFHVGVIMAAIRRLENVRKHPGVGPDFNEEYALAELRGQRIVPHLDRCYKMRDGTVTKEMKDYLFGALISPAPAKQGQRADKRQVLRHSPIAPLIRAGILSDDGRFACLGALWYYNLTCFPNRATEAPKTLRELLLKAVGSMSAKRLRDSAPSGDFPKEAAFQQMFNETMSMHMPIQHAVIPELNTRAVDPQDPSKVVTGELDFYVNGDMQWCVEIDRKGDEIGQHLGRFCGENGKYRKVETKDYYVVDCRGPKQGGGVKLVHQHRCTLYFSTDFTSCRCEIKGEQGADIELQM